MQNSPIYQGGRIYSTAQQYRAQYRVHSDDKKQRYLISALERREKKSKLDARNNTASLMTPNANETRDAA